MNTPMSFYTLIFISLNLLHCGGGEPTHVQNGPPEGADEICVLGVDDSTTYLECGDQRVPLSLHDGEPGAPGAMGLPGESGVDGRDGEAGQHGMDGMDGQSVRVNTTLLAQGSQECPYGGRRLDVFEGDHLEPSASIVMCDVPCSQGEMYEPAFEQCIKFVEIEFEGVAQRVAGTLPTEFAPSRSIVTSTLGIPDPGVTVCTGTLHYPFMQAPTSRTSERTEFEFGQYSKAGITLRIGDHTYQRDPDVQARHTSTMSRQLLEDAALETGLTVNVTQEALLGAPSYAAFYLSAGDDVLQEEELLTSLESPDVAQAWNALGDQEIEEITLYTLDEVTERTASVTCRITQFH